MTTLAENAKNAAGMARAAGTVAARTVPVAAAAGASAAARAAQTGVATAARVSEEKWRRARVRQLTPAQVAEVRALFDASDTLQRGSIDRIELRAAVHALSGQWMSDDELNAVWASVARPAAPSAAPGGAAAGSEGGAGAGREAERDALDFDAFLLLVGPQLFPSPAATLVRSAASRAGAATEHVAATVEERAEAAGVRASERMIEAFVGAASRALTSAALDPDMPALVQRAVARTVDLILEDVEVEVREAVAGLIRRPLPPPPPPDRARALPCVRWAHAARAWLLYSLYPYDQTVWRQLRSPAFLLLRAVSLVPRWGVHPAFFLALFLLIDRTDEYQLVTFILSFKGTQFISIGLLGAVIGAGWYYGAGCGEPFPIEAASAALFGAQVLVTYAAFLLLPCSVEKGRRRYKPLPGESPPRADGECCGRARFAGRGGYLRPLLMYDLGAVGLAVLLIVTALFTLNADEDAVRLSATLYWARTLYGLLAFPFPPFLLPGLRSVLTHSLPTGYNRHGVCVPLATPAELRERHEARRASAEQRRDARELGVRRAASARAASARGAAGAGGAHETARVAPARDEAAGAMTPEP